jgi:20S proteasome alpha/beta subunit|tara:strand:+ start:1920 stop:2384 length:465 start_codon:yes stop_codon:yes gene_type:complete
MSQSMRDALQDGIALLGTALASIGSAGYLPDSITMVAAGGGGLAIVAMLEKAWRNNKDEIIEEIEDFVEEKTGIDLELDEAIEEVVDAAIDTAKDIAEDGDLDVSLKDRADDLKDSLKDMTVKELKAQLKEKGLSLDGKKADLIERLLSAGDDE